jgi:hypothetical protein
MRYGILYACLLLNQSGALATEAGQQIYRSAHYLGRGDTGIATADNQEALFYNPAGIARGKGIWKKLVLASPMIEASTDMRDLYKELNASDSDVTAALRKRVGKPEHLGIYNFSGLVLRRVGIGVVNSATTDLLIYKSPEQGGLESVDAKFYQTNGLVFGIGESFFSEQLLIGATGKYLQRGQAKFNANITDAQKVKDMKSDDLLVKGTGVGADIGVIFKKQSRINPSLGLTVQNVGKTKFIPDSSGKELDPLEQTVNLGLAIEPGTKTSGFKLLTEYKDIAGTVVDSPYKKIHLGGELTVREIFGVTAGLAQGATSFGLYLDLIVMRLDGGLYIQETDDRAGVRPDKRMFLRLVAGF